MSERGIGSSRISFVNLHMRDPFLLLEIGDVTRSYSSSNEVSPSKNHHSDPISDSVAVRDIFFMFQLGIIQNTGLIIH